MPATGKSQFVPKGMRVTAERLAAFTRNRFRIENAGSNSALPGQIITVTLPSNTLVDLHSLKMHGTFTARGGGSKAQPKDVEAYAVDDKFADGNVQSFSVKPAPPEDMHQLISRMTISANGTAIQQGCIEYNTVHKLKSILDRPQPQRQTVDNAIGFAGTYPKSATKEADLVDTTPQGPGVRVAHYYGLNNGEYLPTTGIDTFFDANDGEDGLPSEGTSGERIINGSGELYTTSVKGRMVGRLEKITPSREEYLNGLDSRDFTLYDWRGFCKESSVRYLPTDLVGAMQIQLTLAGPEVLGWFGRGQKGLLLEGDYRGLHGRDGAGKYNNVDVYKSEPGIKPASYQIDDIYWTVDTISVDQAYGDMLRGKIAQYGYISLLFKEYYTFFKSGWQTKNDQHRFSLAAGSMDKVYSVLRDADYNRGCRQAHTHLYELDHCYSPMFRFICPSLLDKHNYGVPYVPTLLKNIAGETLPVGTVTAAYPPRPSWHFDRDTNMSFNYKVNSVMHPQYECHERDAIWDTAYGQDNVNGPNAGNQIESRAAWFEHKAIFPLNLNLTDGPLQLMSGYDSRGHSSFVEFNINGLTHGCMDSDCTNNYQYTMKPGGGEDDLAMFPHGLTTTTIVETTSELRVGAGLSLAVAR